MNSIATKMKPISFTEFETPNSRISTNWIVFTGAPCSGKTSVLEQLKTKGYPTIPEVARQVIQHKLNGGASINEIKNSGVELQQEILRKKITIESELPSDKLIFHDRGVHDSITYLRLAGSSDEHPLTTNYKYRYMLVFLFERLPFRKDSARTESLDKAEQIEKWLKIDYRRHGYRLISIPVMSIEKRCDLILSKIRSNL